MAGKLKYIVIIFVIIVLFLTGLNFSKFSGNSLFNNRKYDYLSGTSHFIPGNIFYSITRLELNSPVTYLRREIPLLGHYTPEVLREPSDTAYNIDKADNVIKLQFDMRESLSTSQQNQEDREYVSKERQEQLDEKIEEKKDIIEKREEAEKPEEDRSPLIGIYHTHTAETYMDDARPQDGNARVMPGEIGNVAQVGQALADTLSSKYNYRVIHTTRVHDKEYNRSYYNSRQTVKKMVENNPEMDILLDIHRDGLETPVEGTYTEVIDDRRIAKIMIVVTNGRFDFAHLDLEDHHREWQRNLRFARKLATKMDEMYPGLLKRVEIRDTIYNQDLHPRGLLLEIGDYTNTTGEAVRSARMLADVIAALD